MANFRLLLRNSQPLQLLLAALMYSLGTGISRYLGSSINGVAFTLGLVAILSLQLASTWLIRYFHIPFTPLSVDTDETFAGREKDRLFILQASYALLTLAGAIFISMLALSILTIASAFLYALIALFLIAFVVPPIGLPEKGFGELVMAIYLGTLLPSFAFLLQYREFHRLLTFATFPLTLLALAYLIISDFPTFATDQKMGWHTLLTRLTWQRAIPIHHFLILAAFLLFAVSPLEGFPWGLVWPVFAVLPFAAVQIIWLQRISLGGRTLWSFVTTLSVTTFGLTAYLLAFTFWSR